MVLATGASYPAVSEAVVKDFKIRLPSIPEQQLIVRRLDLVRSVRKRYAQLAELAEELLQSAFLEMFGDPVVNPKNWPLDSLDKCLKGIEAGWSAKGEDRPPKGDEWAVLKVSAITSGRFLVGERKAVHASDMKGSPIVPKRGDLLFSRANTRELVAATCLVEEDVVRTFLPDKLWRIIPRSTKVRVEYLRYLLANAGFRSELRRQATGTSGSMLNISQEKLLRTKIPVPPEELQDWFAATVWETYAFRSRCKAGSSHAGTLASSLLDELQRG